MMRSQQRMSDIQAFAIALAYASGIKPKATYELMSKGAGGRANLGKKKKKKTIFELDDNEA